MANVIIFIDFFYLLLILYGRPVCLRSSGRDRIPFSSFNLQAFLTIEIGTSKEPDVFSYVHSLGVNVSSCTFDL